MRRPCLGSCAAIAAVTLPVLLEAPFARADPRRYRTDDDDLAWMRKDRPHAAEQFEKGEAALFASDAKQAADLFATAAAEAPQGALPNRRHCEALAKLGRRDEAVEACRKAVSAKGSAMDYRALVGAMMSGSEPPTMQETGMALIFARKARELMPTEPWGYAAQCDVAEKLGDTEMLNDCVKELEKVAPGHYETERVVSITASLRPSWGVGAGWAAIALAGLGTFAHAFRRRLSSRAGAAGATLGLLCGLWGIAAPARADGILVTDAPHHAQKAGALSKWVIDEKDPESSVPSAVQRDSDPLEYGYHLMDLTDAAGKATKRGDHQAAIKYYRAIAKAVPDVSISFAQVCDAYEAAGERDKATESCAIALNRPGVRISDFQHYARLILSKRGALNDADVENIDAVIEHLKADQHSRLQGWEMQCDLGVRLADRNRLELCTPEVVAAAPDDTKTIFFQWSLAVLRKDFTGAEQLVKRIQATSMKPQDVQTMKESMIKAMPLWRRALWDWRIGATVAIVICGMAAMFMVWRRPATQAA